jgi:hypothetical protein
MMVANAVTDKKVHYFIQLQTIVTTIAIGRIFGLFTVAQPHFGCFGNANFLAFVRKNRFALLVGGGKGFVGTIAKRVVLAKSASTPSIGFVGFEGNFGWLIVGRKCVHIVAL